MPCTEQSRQNWKLRVSVGTKVILSDILSASLMIIKTSFQLTESIRLYEIVFLT